MKLKEIAAAAGVSQASISIVRKGNPGVSRETRIRIQQLLRENGFSYAEYDRRHQQKQSPPAFENATQYVRLIKFKRHAMLVDGNEGFVSSIIEALDHESRKHNYHLIISTVTPDAFPSFLADISKDAIASVIVIATEMEQSDVDQLAVLPFPIVLIDSEFVYSPYCCVTMNNQEIAYQAVSYLHRLGHRSIGYLMSKVDTGNFDRRTAGFLEALKHLGLPLNKRMCFSVGPTMNKAHNDMVQLLKQGAPMPTAFFAANDTIAIGCMKAIRQHGYRIPDDISIIGVDNIPFAEISEPPLTTIGVSCASIGRTVISVLLHIIRSDEPTPRTKTLISGELIVRQSTAAVPMQD